MSANDAAAAQKNHDIEVQLEKAAEPILPPFDGRRGWLMATGGFLGLFATFVSTSDLIDTTADLSRAGIHQRQAPALRVAKGHLLTPRPAGFGAYQSYYLQRYDTNSATISLIGGLQVACLYLGGPFSGRAVDVFGPKLVIGAGTIICTFSLMMLSLTSAIWQVSAVLRRIRDSELTSVLAIAGLPLPRLAVWRRNESRQVRRLLCLCSMLTRRPHSLLPLHQHASNLLPSAPRIGNRLRNLWSQLGRSHLVRLNLLAQ